MSHERVVTTALELFARRGVDGVSISEIAEAAEMSKANVIHHVRTKDQLYRVCLEAIGERLDAAASAATAAVERSDAEAEPAVRAALERWSIDHPDDVRLMAYGLLRLQERPGPWVLEQAVESLMAVIDGPPDEAADTILDLLGQVTYRVMSEQLRAAVDATARRSRASRPTNEPTATGGTP